MGVGTGKARRITTLNMNEKQESEETAGKQG